MLHYWLDSMPANAYITHMHDGTRKITIRVNGGIFTALKHAAIDRGVSVQTLLVSYIDNLLASQLDATNEGNPSRSHSNDVQHVNAPIGDRMPEPTTERKG